MVEVKLLDGVPVPDDYLTSVSLIVRDAALTIDVFGEDELEVESQRGTSQDAWETPAEQKRCVCGAEALCDQAILEGEYVLRTYAGREGDVETAYATLKAAIAAFHAAPLNSNPRVIRGGKTLVELNRKLTPIFSDAEAQRIHRELTGGYVLRRYAGFGKGDVDTTHPTLEAAVTAFAAAPANSIPRVVRDGRTVAELDPEAGLAPIFRDTEVQRVYRKIVDQRGFEQDSSDP